VSWLVAPGPPVIVVRESTFIPPRMIGEACFNLSSLDYVFVRLVVGLPAKGESTSGIERPTELYADRIDYNPRITVFALHSRRMFCYLPDSR